MPMQRSQCKGERSFNWVTNLVQPGIDLSFGLQLFIVADEMAIFGK